MIGPEHIPGVTTHARRGEIGNAFRYGVDFVLIDPDRDASLALFSRNKMNLASVHDCDHGGQIGDGTGVAWARMVLAERGLKDAQIKLLTQPRFFGYQFNPVSFWLAFRGAELAAVIAEVNTPFGDRHNYVCHREGFAPIRSQDQITACKMMHVSPFQDVSGEYRFNFDIRPDRIGIRIAHLDGDQGVIATLSGPRQALSNGRLVSAFLRRPAGAMRTIALIYWQALKLKLKGARYRTRPEPAATDIT
ncbi:DUF1365 domain-containing protein [Falsiphaeobacter marinintestinus]|uniref:DUF1365 domain-containing protein n=1 Tax=Falsiphaeobacter marinintestinus TaxID=1492905 RepID=UPI0011B7B10F|nr:DUF1365 domain-containing protein [Phaeobacter marinintestinus]